MVESFKLGGISSDADPHPNSDLAICRAQCSPYYVLLFPCSSYTALYLNMQFFSCQCIQS